MTSSHPTPSSCDHGGHDHGGHDHGGHDHGGHDHGGHGAKPTEQDIVIRRLTAASWLCLAFLLVEIVGGYLSGSLAVLSDAAHLFADLASFFVAIIAARLAARPTTTQHTFGLKRAESLAALLSMLSLAIVSVGLAMEAIDRLYKNEGNVDGKMMSIVAGIGVIVNIALALVLGVENHVHMPGGTCDHDHNHGEDKSHSHDHGHDNSHGHDQKDEEDHHCHKEEDNHHCHEESNEHNKSHDHSHAHGHCGHNDESDEGLEEGHKHSHNHSATESTGLVCDKHGKGKYHALDSDDSTPSSGEPRNVNLQAAYLHVMGDLAQSVGVLIAGLLIWYNPNWHIMDPIITLIFCGLVFKSTLGVIRTSISVLLEEVPSNIKWTEMFTAIQEVEGVINVHDLHIWSISHGIPSLSVHCTVKGDSDTALKSIYAVVKERGIKHATIQIQVGMECLTCYEPCNDELTLSRVSRERTM